MESQMYPNVPNTPQILGSNISLGKKPALLSWDVLQICSQSSQTFGSKWLAWAVPPIPPGRFACSQLSWVIDLVSHGLCSSNAPMKGSFWTCTSANTASDKVCKSSGVGFRYMHPHKISSTALCASRFSRFTNFSHSSPVTPVPRTFMVMHKLGKKKNLWIQTLKITIHQFGLDVYIGFNSRLEWYFD